MIRILIVDDHAIVREGLYRIFAMTPDIEVAGELSNGGQVLDYLKDNSIDLLLLDMSRPGSCGVDLIRDLCRLWPFLPVLLFSNNYDSIFITNLIKSGAKGYIPKDSDLDTILSAVRACAAGKYYLHPSIGAKLMMEQRGASRQELHHSLSCREYQVFELLLKGFSLSLIGSTLNVSPKTISTHKFRIMQKLSMTSVSELVRYAVKAKLIDG